MCTCYDGYDGKDCENDIDECLSGPCLNGGLCLQMSDEDNYEEDFEYRDLFPDEFSYANASGYVCVCEPGFDGIQCEINIDECESNPCQNGATCKDQVNGYRCNCASGWEGPNCENEIDECASLPCQNGGTCTDEIAMYTCACTSEYGGLNCEVLLTACMDNDECLNGATCIPSYDHETGRHLFSCECMPGYTGERCEVSTSASFKGSEGMYMVDSNTNNKDTLSYSLSFATTLSSGLLLYSGDSADYILLEMFEGQLYFTYSSLLFEPLEIRQLGTSLSDGEWHSVKLTITDMDITLSVTGTIETNDLVSRCSDGTCSETIPRNGNTVVLDSLYIGGLDSSRSDKISLTRSGLVYTGCMQDIANDGTPVLPPGVSGKTGDITALGEADGGCARTEQCTPDPCSGNGFCTDLWWEYSCECNLGWTGPNCNHSKYSRAVCEHLSVTS